MLCRAVREHRIERANDGGRNGGSSTLCRSSSCRRPRLETRDAVLGSVFLAENRLSLRNPQWLRWPSATIASERMGPTKKAAVDPALEQIDAARVLGRNPVRGAAA